MNAAGGSLNADKRSGACGWRVDNGVPRASKCPMQCRKTDFTKFRGLPFQRDLAIAKFVTNTHRAVIRILNEY